MGRRSLHAFAALAGALVFASDTATQADPDQCTAWMPDSDHDGIDLMTCAYAVGSSGYNRWRNRYARDARISFRFEFNNGRTYEASTSIPANGVTDSSACWGCGRAGGGMRRWSITRFALRGDPGFL